LQGIYGTHHKSKIGQIYFYATNPGKQFLVNAKRKTTLIELLIGISRPIQGQCKTRPASAAGSEINADIPAFFVRKIRFKLFTGTFAKFKHEKASTVFTPCCATACNSCQYGAFPPLSMQSRVICHFPVGAKRCKLSLHHGGSYEFHPSVARKRH